MICPFETKIEKGRQREKLVLCFVAVLLFLRAQELFCLVPTAPVAVGTAGVPASFLPEHRLLLLSDLGWAGKEDYLNVNRENKYLKITRKQIMNVHSPSLDLPFASFT